MTQSLPPSPPWRFLVAGSLLWISCGGAHSAPVVENTSDDSAPETVPEGDDDSEAHGDDRPSCGCPPDDDHTEATCPDNGYGPASRLCRDNPDTKYCGCPGDSPCGGADFDNPCGFNPCGSNPCGENPCGHP